MFLQRANIYIYIYIYIYIWQVLLQRLHQKVACSVLVISLVSATSQQRNATKH